MKKLLVFGRRGQLGTALHTFGQSHEQFEIRVLGRPDVDLTDSRSVAALIDTENPDGIINAAAYTAVDDAEQDEENAFRLNATAPHWLAKCAKKRDIPLIHVSTDYVFDGNSETPYRPNDDIAPINTYGRTKLAGEWGCLGTHPDKTYVVRTSWVYSEWGSNFVKTMLKLGETRTELAVVHDQVGSPTYAADLAQACLDMMSQILDGVVDAPGIYHFSNAGTCSWFEFAQEIFKSSESMNLSETTSEKFPRPAKRPQFSKLDVTKFEETFSITTRPWQNALDECLKNLTKIITT